MVSSAGLTMASGIREAVRPQRHIDVSNRHYYAGSTW